MYIQRLNTNHEPTWEKMSGSKLFINGRIFTSRTGDEELHDSMLVEGDKVACVGTKDVVSRAVSRVSPVVHPKRDRYKVKSLTVYDSSRQVTPWKRST